MLKIFTKIESKINRNGDWYINMDNLFDIVKDKMFSILASKDRRTNYDLLMTIYDLLFDKERKQYMDKDELVDNLVAYIKGRDFDSFDNEDGEDIAKKDAKFLANTKLRQFKQSGWIEEESGACFDIIITINANAIQLLETFRAIVTNNNKPLEYTGYFYTIYGLLKNFEYKQSKAIIEQITKNTRELFSSLHGLNSSIKTFIENLMKSDNMSPEEILELLLDKYQKQIILTVFNNLKGRDNPSKFTSDILSKLREIRYENIDQVVDNYIKTTSIEIITSEVYSEVENDICNSIDDVISRFESVGEFISIIDYKNAKFHSSALSKLEFLLNSRMDIDGLVVQSIKQLKNVDENNEFDNIIQLESSNLLDDMSLYQRAFNKEKASFVESPTIEVDEDELNKKYEMLLNQDDNSKNMVNEYVLKIMSNQQSITLQQINISNIEEFFMIILIQVYAEYDDMVYSINFLNNPVYKYGYDMVEFELIRRIV